MAGAEDQEMVEVKPEQKWGPRRPLETLTKQGLKQRSDMIYCGMRAQARRTVK